MKSIHHTPSSFKTLNYDNLGSDPLKGKSKLTFLRVVVSLVLIGERWLGLWIT